jgi:hypothetical protein
MSCLRDRGEQNPAASLGLYLGRPKHPLLAKHSNSSVQSKTPLIGKFSNVKNGMEGPFPSPPIFCGSKMAFSSILAYRCKGRPNCMRERSSRSDMASPSPLDGYKAPLSPPHLHLATSFLLLYPSTRKWPPSSPPCSLAPVLPAAVPPPGPFNHLFVSA